MSESIVTVGDLRMRYGAVDVLHEVSFEARPGEVLALLGPNGAGKTTTIEILEGFRMRSAGRVEVLGADPAQADESWRARVGVVLQSWRDHGKWRVGELLAAPRLVLRAVRDDRDATAVATDELIAAVGLTEQRGPQDPDALRRSAAAARRGDRHRRAARAAVPRRADGRLRPRGAARVPRPGHAAGRGDGTTILLTTHDLDEAEKLADRILILDRRAGSSPTARRASWPRRIAGEDEVRWTRRRTATSGSRPPIPPSSSASCSASTATSVAELEVRRASLEDTYLALVRRSRRSAR